ncbi:MAG TPA: alpha-mannosidase [Candidatus Pullilachnospira intestinigallinarum]|nr:alpha-mannosidase [Candidatus Pullilachnospira intestinigallinarum]
MREKNVTAKFKELKKNAWSGIWAKRILSELQYLLELQDFLSAKQNELVQGAVEKLWFCTKEQGAITKDAVLALEKDLEPVKETARSLTVLVVAHAHIDMNWMWGFQETASVTVDTFETMLQLMEEYPQFKFSQSQASVYRILEEYYPELLDRVRQRVREGRWEVTASSWVENDKNMAGGEAMARHLLYTKTYLSGLLGIPRESLNIDFEPDTFGHSENVPEILNQGGVKYYYHCRGYDGEHVYRWRAPSGAEVLVYREPVWYNDEVVEYDCLGYVPGFCRKYGLTTALKLYGVGDHGGGPTRRDISRWIEMQSWPLMPEIRFGTMGEFFARLEKVRDRLPVVEQELNYIFTGCYTSQARIKRANKIGEDRLYEAEALDAMARRLAPDYRPGSEFRSAWEKILFNQFHDILPGSGVMETREYALGEFQRAMAASQINLNHAMRSICARMDTSALGEQEEAGRSFGAGAGFGMGDACGYMTGYAERTSGLSRIVTAFNPLPYTRRGVIRAVLWDWQGEARLLTAKDQEGNPVDCQVVEEGTRYWGHHYHTVLLYGEVKGLGYASFVLEEQEEERLHKEWASYSNSPAEDPRLDHFTDLPLVLENELVKAVFDRNTMKLISFVDKETGKEHIQEPSCTFRLIRENAVQEMTAWRVGQWMEIHDLNREAPVKLLEWTPGLLRQQAVYEIPFGQSSLKAVVSLEKGSRTLAFDVTVEWHELGNCADGVPQLNFAVPFAGSGESYLCAVPFGVKERSPLAQDVPCTGFMGQKASAGDRAVLVMSDCKYGFRGWQDAISLALLRGSFDPDPTPDQGTHPMRIGVGLAAASGEDMTRVHQRFVHPVYACSNSAHTGTIPCAGSILQVEGGAGVDGVKISEDGKRLVVRLHSLSGNTAQVILKTGWEPKEAALADVMENPVQQLSVEEGAIRLELPAGAVRTVSIG